MNCKLDYWGKSETAWESSKFKRITVPCAYCDLDSKDRAMIMLRMSGK